MYAIEIKDRSEHVVVVCPTLSSAKDWIYTQIINYMREDVAKDLNLSTMYEITQHYADELEALRKLREDAAINKRFCTYRSKEYRLRKATEGDIKAMFD